jgi:hypothetical protein
MTPSTPDALSAETLLTSWIDEIPPLAIIGVLVNLVISVSKSRLGPVSVPSLEISVTT